MPGKIKCSASRKAAYKRYEDENRQEKNKDNKLMKHLLKHPTDKQSEERRGANYETTASKEGQTRNKRSSGRR